MDEETKKLVKERFALLPKVVQDAITSTAIEQSLRDLANTHKLHLDQWQLLENEVLMVLYGFSSPDTLAASIQSEVGTTPEVAAKLTEDISKIVFLPIRQELERRLDHPDAKAAEVSATEAARAQILSDSAQKTVPSTTTAPIVAPATPPAPPPSQKAIRSMPASGAYKPGEASAVRKDVHDDPYRESPA